MNFLKIKAENDRIFSDGIYNMHSDYFAEFPIGGTPRSGHFSVKEHTLCMTAIECVISSRGKSTIVLNFANANTAGGAYALGGNAQEESLCRCSMLYYTIKECGEYYKRNRLHILPDYTDGMIYSENVPVIRDESGKLLREPLECDFITCPAVNKRLASPFMNNDKLNMIMKRRISRIISLAASKAPDIVILGAFGCGAFGNDRKDVYPMFEEAIDKFGGNSAEYVFAVPDFK